MIRVLTGIGEFVIKRIGGFIGPLIFAFEILVVIVNPKSYNRVMLNVLIRQIYFSSIQIIPLVSVLSMVLGTILIAVIVLVGESLGIMANEIFSPLIVSEIAPLIVFVLIALRSSSAINTEIAIMNVNRDLSSLEHFNVNLFGYLYTPRIIAGMVAVFLLSFIFIVVTYLSGYLFTLLYNNYSVDYYLTRFILVLTPVDLLIFVFKSVTFGFFAILIPIYSALKMGGKSYNMVPISVLSGMVRLFITIVILEVLSLILYII